MDHAHRGGYFWAKSGVFRRRAASISGQSPWIAKWRVLFASGHMWAMGTRMVSRHVRLEMGLD